MLNNQNLYFEMKLMTFYTIIASLLNMCHILQINLSFIYTTIRRVTDDTVFSAFSREDRIEDLLDVLIREDHIVRYPEKVVVAVWKMIRRFPCI